MPAILLVVVAGVLLALVTWCGLTWWGACLGFAVLAATILCLPIAARPTDLITAPSVALAAQAAEDDAAVAAFADALVDPCLVLDARATLVHANGAAQRRFPAISVGKRLTLALRNPELVQAVEAAQRTGRAQTIEIHETLPSETWDKVVIAPLLRAGEHSQQLIMTVQSLTELKRVDAMRSDFIANASHELRTPLASLLGFIDTLLGPAANDPAARERFLGIMRGQADRMSKLVDDLLSLSRIEMHQHIRPTGTIELAGLLREVRDGLQTQAEAAGLDIVLSLPEGPARTIGDRGQLYEVFENLIDNALKYGSGGKTVEVVLLPANKLGFAHMVSVVDHGPGVPPEHVPRLTERFYRIDAETSRKRKGTGLGLAIVKHIVSRHRGQLSIRSELGQGMRVDVLLP
ncbi:MULTISPECIES: ATP-binding protein [unclassified Devosia]|uniref:ATP-binding protein n=1 Tax=unclassified Devosia TaxID=196773 RepID=UPI0015527879